MNQLTMRPLRIVFLLGCLTLMLGCGDGRKAVSGTVTLDGQPLPSGNITFIARDGTVGPSTGGVIENGVYKLESDKGLVPGRYQVKIQAFRPSQNNLADAGEEPLYAPEPYLPARYNDSSELEVEFTGDALPPFDLQSDSE